MWGWGKATGTGRVTTAGQQAGRGARRQDQHRGARVKGRRVKRPSEEDVGHSGVGEQQQRKHAACAPNHPSTSNKLRKPSATDYHDPPDPLLPPTASTFHASLGNPIRQAFPHLGPPSGNLPAGTSRSPDRLPLLQTEVPVQLIQGRHRVADAVRTPRGGPSTATPAATAAAAGCRRRCGCRVPSSLDAPLVVAAGGEGAERREDVREQVAGGVRQESREREVGSREREAGGSVEGVRGERGAWGKGAQDGKKGAGPTNQRASQPSNLTNQSTSRPA